jgi:hypothetical protein
MLTMYQQMRDTTPRKEAHAMKMNHRLTHFGATTRAGRAAMLLATLWLNLGVLSGCGIPIRMGGPDSTHALIVPDDHYAVYEVDITESGVYALSVLDLDPKASNKLVDRVRSLNRIAEVLEGSIRLPGSPGQIGTDSFDDLAGVIWAVYGRGKDSAATPAAAPAATPTAQPALPTVSAKLDPGTLGPRLMQSTERPLAERGQRAPERARLEPGRYLIRVATGYGSQRTEADRVDVGLVRLPDLPSSGTTSNNSAPVVSRVPAVPFGTGSAAPTPPSAGGNPAPAPAPR